MNVATRRLIDASATLPAADRALLSLWTQRGLDDAAMARMTGMTAAAIVERRERIVGALSVELGLPPQDISGALAGIATSAAAVAASPLPGTEAPSQTATEPAPGDSSPGPGPAPSAMETSSQAEPEPSSVKTEPELEGEKTAGTCEPSDERRRLTLATFVILGAVAAIVVIALVAGGNSKGSAHTAPAAATTTAPTATTRAAPPTAAAATPTPTTHASTSAAVRTAPARAPAALAPLPGAGPRASGTVSLAGTGARRTLQVRANGLPVAAPGHYEVFLYDSIIDSQPLGTLSAAGGGSFRLPANAAHYAWIDISRQTGGNAIPDGASVLRAANPAHAG